MINPPSPPSLLVTVSPPSLSHRFLTTHSFTAFHGNKPYRCPSPASPLPFLVLSSPLQSRRQAVRETHLDTLASVGENCECLVSAYLVVSEAAPRPTRLANPPTCCMLEE
ncbi:hypothetical protein E2C01_073504 [Portunus trituberculatus]|uniref:Uncharacterized protein n=1 Tax=Portunus trituberculatus TaxID=210409 RepID=A0A5B7I9K3_PORTR|nr:hypothetical protein [Portunus trituberculatus]